MIAWRTALLVLLVTLAACGPEYALVPPPTAEGRMCAAQCGQTEALCRQNCTMGQQTCLSTERVRAAQEYDRYVDHQLRFNLDVSKEPKDFVQTWRCQTSSCTSGCAAERRDCHQSCGGQVVEKKE
jgi:hypothetical protein